MQTKKTTPLPPNKNNAAPPMPANKRNPHEKEPEIKRTKSIKMI